VAKFGTPKAGGTIIQLGCGTSVACHGKPIKEEEDHMCFLVLGFNGIERQNNVSKISEKIFTVMLLTNET
jgi:hypothetical protein